MPEWIYEKQRIATELGLLIMEFNRLDSMLASAISSVVSSSDINNSVELNNIFQASMSFSQKVDLFVALVFSKSPNLSAGKEFLEELVKESSSLEQERNKYVHADYYPKEVDGGNVVTHKHRIRGRKGLKSTIEDININNLKELRQRIIGLCEKLALIDLVDDLDELVVINQLCDITKHEKIT